MAWPNVKLGVVVDLGYWLANRLLAVLISYAHSPACDDLACGAFRAQTCSIAVSIELVGEFPVDRHAEIAQLNHELEILRERRANFERNDRMLRAFFVGLPIASIPVLAILFFHDPIAGFFIWGLTFAMCAISFLLYPIDPANRTNRIISVAMGNFAFQRRSDPDILEEQIAERERRLTELTASQ